MIISVAGSIPPPTFTTVVRRPVIPNEVRRGQTQQKNQQVIAAYQENIDTTE